MSFKSYLYRVIFASMNVEENIYKHLQPYTGYRARVVRIGDLEMGGAFPVRVQSMTNTPTMETDATVKQVIGLADAGCELVRITAQNTREAQNLQNIKRSLLEQGYRIPIAADIHYLPEAAEVAARFVEKVRINPGNYSDRKWDPGKGFSQTAYNEELERVAERLAPLLRICRENGTALRIGTNHGSLSERIVYRYGNTPMGMVESALEFARICRDMGFLDLVISMKASNILTVLHANRMLVSQMKEEGMDFPVHLGVTEAGEGEDGRIKSAAGIGVLLSEGIGDTIRVSLTEDPVNEIPFAQLLAGLFREGEKRKTPPSTVLPASPYRYSQHITHAKGKLGGGQAFAVLSDAPVPGGEDPVPDIVLTGGKYPEGPVVVKSEATEDALQLRQGILDAVSRRPGEPLLLHKDLGDLQGEAMIARASIDLGMALTDGYGDGLILTGGMGSTPAARVKLAFDILQATGRRISKTEYISCPSCGRTQFDIQEALRKVKARTSHLVGLKIAVMGCIVNGPGEMADADYGYVGGGPGKVHIYKGHQLVKRNIPQEEAVDELLKIITETMTQ